MSKSIVIMINGNPVPLKQIETGYFMGCIDIYVFGKSVVDFHVEAVQVSSNNFQPYAKNNNYQPVIEAWLDHNEACTPHLLEIEKKFYFINVEVFAK